MLRKFRFPATAVCAVLALTLLGTQRTREPEFRYQQRSSDYEQPSAMPWKVWVYDAHSTHQSLARKWSTREPNFQLSRFDDNVCSATLREHFQLDVTTSLQLSNAWRSVVCGLAMVYAHGGFFVPSRASPTGRFGSWFAKQEARPGRLFFSNFSASGRGSQVFGGAPRHQCLRSALEGISEVLTGGRVDRMHSFRRWSDCTSFGPYSLPLELSGFHASCLGAADIPPQVFDYNANCGKKISGLSVVTLSGSATDVAKTWQREEDLAEINEVDLVSCRVHASALGIDTAVIDEKSTVVCLGLAVHRFGGIALTHRARWIRPTFEWFPHESELVAVRNDASPGALFTDWLAGTQRSSCVEEFIRAALNATSNATAVVLSCGMLLPPEFTRGGGFLA